MKILFFIDVLTSGGKERRLVELMKELKVIPNYEFELALMSNEISYKEVFDLNIPIHYLVRKTKRDISVFKMLYRLCKKISPDLIHCWGSMTAVYSVPVCKLLHIKLVNGLITDAPERRNIFNNDWFRAKITFPFSDLIISNSKAGLVAYNAIGGKCYFVHNGFNYKRVEKIIDNEIIINQIDIKTKYIIGMVANNSINKDYATFFKAAKILLNKRKDITFVAIGKDTDSESSMQQIDSQFINFFRLLGIKSNIESYVNVMDICVLSTFTEGISNSILEYMALGKPVVATSGGGTNEIVINNKTGFLIDKSNPVELAEKINVLLDNNKLRADMGAAGKVQIQNNFSISNMISGYCKLYNKIYSKMKIEKLNILSKNLRGILGYILIKINFIYKSSYKQGILSIYFHNPSKALFEKIVKWLLAKGYRFISIKELENCISQKQSAEKLVYISFDDGWRGNLDIIETIEKYKVPVTIFIPIAALENGNYWWEYTLIEGQQKITGIKKPADFLSLSEKMRKEKIEILRKNYQLERSCITLDELIRINENESITIASHSVTHPLLDKSSSETLNLEFAESKRILSKWLQKEVNYFSYPMGVYNDNIVECAKRNNYKLCFTTRSGKINLDNVNPFIIPRISMNDHGGYYENIARIAGNWDKLFHVSNTYNEFQ